VELKSPAEEAGESGGTSNDGESVADKSAGLPKEVQEELKKMRELIEQQSTRLRNAEGHLGGLNSQLKQFSATAQETRKAGIDSPTAKQIEAAKGDPEKMAQLIEDYPEFGGAVKAALDEREERLLEKIRESASGGVEDAVSRSELDKVRAEMFVELHHKGWQKTIRTDEFASWLSAQKPEVMMLARSSDPDHAIRVLDMFGESKKAAPDPARQEKQLRSAAAAAIPDSGRSSRSSASIKPFESMTKEEYWAHLDAVEKEGGKG
jgi:hypothetical protein